MALGQEAEVVNLPCKNKDTASTPEQNTQFCFNGAAKQCGYVVEAPHSYSQKKRAPEMRKSLIHVLTLVAVSVLPAIAGQMSVGDLLKLCTSPDEGDKNACTFYILGV